MRSWIRFLTLAVCCAALVSLPAAGSPEPPPAGDPPASDPPASDPPASDPIVPWQIGLLRVRDLTPFGITRLDMLPAHAVPATPGTWALEVNLAYQNTYVLSPNAEEYLRERRGGARGRLTQEEIDGIFALPDDAYYVDGELGLFDLTYHYRFNRHWGTYVTLPVFYYGGGFLDRTIEDFHSEFGFSTAGRDLAERDQFQFCFRVGENRRASLEPPTDGGVGDPVVALRYSLVPFPERWQMVLEAAAKIPWDGERFLLSSGQPDFGTQLSFQRWGRRNALYLTLSGIYFSGTKSELDDEPQIIPTALLGYELRLTRKTNGILQLYASRSTVRDTTIEELSDNKYQVTLGVQTRRQRNVLRFAVTENLANFSNTPDVGITLSYARVVPGRR
jgi:hypothetical protein